jgi:hypothetical protein
MDEQYPKIVVDSRLARGRLAQAFELGGDWETERRFSPVSDRTFAATPQKNAGKSDRPISDLVRSITSFVYRIRSRTLGERPGAAKRDISGFGFLLVLVHLSEIAAAQTDNPAFWLLVGFTPLRLL